MATAAEQVFIRAVFVAESTRQVAKAAAFVTYAFTPANLSAYQTALEAADNAYIASINSALSTAGGVGISQPNQGPSVQTPFVTLGGAGLTGPIGGNAATFGSIA